MLTFKLSKNFPKKLSGDWNRSQFFMNLKNIFPLYKTCFITLNYEKKREKRVSPFVLLELFSPFESRWFVVSNLVDKKTACFWENGAPSSAHCCTFLIWVSRICSHFHGRKCWYWLNLMQGCVISASDNCKGLRGWDNSNIF